MRLSHRQIEAFRAIIESGSVTAAADLLFLTQPSVSRLLADLEAELGFALFARIGRSLTPTPEADALYEEVRRSFVGLQEISRVADDIRQYRSGSLKIAAMPALGLQFLPPAGVLAAVMLFVTVLTNFASNTTAAAVGTPIAFSLGQKLGIPVEPLVLAVLFGCNLCYATPVAYQTNMLIMSAGDYRFADYTRTGLPLVAIMVLTLSGLLVLRYGLY